LAEKASNDVAYFMLLRWKHVLLRLNKGDWLGAEKCSSTGDWLSFSCVFIILIYLNIVVSSSGNLNTEANFNAELFRFGAIEATIVIMLQT
jgi:hypothetical protein